MSWEFAPNHASPSIVIEIVDDSSLPVEALVAATFPANVYIQRQGAFPTTTLISASDLNDLASLLTAFTEFGVKHIAKGKYRFDLPISLFAVTPPVDYVLFGEQSGKRIIMEKISVTLTAAIKAKTDLIGTAGATVVSPINEAGDLITIIPGNDYDNDSGNAIGITLDAGAVPDLSGVTVKLAIGPKYGDSAYVMIDTGSVITGSAVTAQEIRFEPLGTETILLDSYHDTKMIFDVIAEYSSGDRSIVRGNCKVLKRLHASP